jgi:hypothetical protein
LENRVIPISVSDILKILDQIPVWKNLAVLPRRIAALEEHIAALESSKLALPPPPAIDPARACPMCGTEMKVMAETNHPEFGFAGLKIHQMSCPSCGQKAIREFDPNRRHQ